MCININSNKPNIIFILADDMGYGDASCYGAHKIHTPNIDKLADEGITFTDAHSSSAVCTPSRYSILTGRYCWRSSLKKWVVSGHDKPIIEKKRLTVASMLKNVGYKTGVFGKWHLGLDWTIKNEYSEIEEDNPWKYDYSKPFKGGPIELGFDYFYGIAGSLDMSPYCYLENDHTVEIPYKEKDFYYPQQRKGLMTDNFKDDEVDQTFVKKAIEFINNCAKNEQPFFAYIPLAAPHRPCVPPDFIKGKSQAGNRGDMVAEVDWCVGQIMNTIDKLNISDNTLFVFTSDNGARPCDVDGIMYNHKSCGNFRGYKADIWDGGHREPFVIRWPNKIKSNIKSHALVSLTDFMATCADIIGYNLNNEEAEDSFSLMPILENKIDKIRDSLVHHSGDGMFSLRMGKWKYIECLGSGGFTNPKNYEPIITNEKGQLYNLENDPYESKNLYLYEPEMVKLLSDELNKIKTIGSKH